MFDFVCFINWPDNLWNLYVIGSLRTPKKWNPNCPYIPFRFFMKEFSKTFLPSDIDLVSKYYKAYKGSAISTLLSRNSCLSSIFLFAYLMLNYFMIIIFQERRMSKQLLVRIVRQITGDKWLIGIINSFRAKVWIMIPFIDSNSKALQCLDV